MPDYWVVNASPIITLAKIARLDLLESPDHELWVPEAVVVEIVAGPKDDPARQAIDGWKINCPSPTIPADILEWGLGAGESSVITLARETKGIAILDDAEGRACAQTLGVRVIGTLGVVLRAKLSGLIPSAGAIHDRAAPSRSQTRWRRRQASAQESLRRGVERVNPSQRPTT